MAYWKTKDGTLIEIKDLHDVHLSRIIKMLRKKATQILALNEYDVEIDVETYLRWKCDVYIDLLKERAKRHQ